MKQQSLPIWMALERMTDEELIGMLPYIRDEDGEKVNLLQLRRYLREKREEERGNRSWQAGEGMRSGAGRPTGFTGS